MRLTIRTTCLLLALAGASAAFAAGDAAAGATKAATCLACHGANGTSTTPAWPNLAGQNAAYLRQQLKSFHDGVRKPLPTDADALLMAPMATALTDQDIADIAAYYSLQTPTGDVANPANYKLGQKLYHGGDKERGIPACAACHGPTGAGNPGAGYPALRAQHEVYTLKQLNHYHDKTRYTVSDKGKSMGGDNAEMMQSIGGRLNADDMKSLATYIQGLR